MEIVQLVGSDALPDKQQVLLEVARLIREFILQQNAFHEVDTYCDPKKSAAMIESVLKFSDLAEEALKKGVRIKQILTVKSKNQIADSKYTNDYKKLLEKVDKEMESEFAKLKS